MIVLNNQYALDGRNASSYRGSFGLQGALRAPLFGPIRQMRSDNTPRRVSASYGIRPGSLGAGHTEVPKEEAYKFYYHVEPCLSLCFGKVPLVRVLVRTENLQCPSCQANLKLSRPSRALASAVGLSIGLAMVRCLGIASVRGEWILAVVVGFVGYGVGCAVALGVISDLVAER